MAPAAQQHQIVDHRRAVVDAPADVMGVAPGDRRTASGEPAPAVPGDKGRPQLG